MEMVMERDPRRGEWAGKSIAPRGRLKPPGARALALAQGQAFLQMLQME
jgi:hypothetical protein